MSCRRSNSGYRQLYRSPGNRWSVDLVLWPRIDLVAVFALGRLTSAPRRWEDRQFGAGSLDVSGTCAPGRAALSREGPRVRIPVPFKAVIGWAALSAGGPGPACRESPTNPRVLSTWSGPAPRQVGRDGSPVGGCASSASTGIDGRRGGPDVSDAREGLNMAGEV